MAAHLFRATALNPVRHGRDAIIVFGVVLANPLTKLDILRDMLAEQRKIAMSSGIQPLVERNKKTLCG